MWNAVNGNGWRGSTTWIDPDAGKLHMYGGYSNSNVPGNGTWSMTINNNTGALGPITYSSVATPGFTNGAIGWQDDDYNFYILANGQFGSERAELYLWQRVAASWSRLGPTSGVNDTNWSGSYGTDDPNNWPAPRSVGSVARDPANRDFVYIYGGGTTEVPIAELWRFNMRSGQWALLFGTPNTGVGHSSQVLGIFDSNTAPGGMTLAHLHADTNGYLWLFDGYSGSGVRGPEVWCYSLVSHLWARIGPTALKLPTITVGPVQWGGSIAWGHSWFFNGSVFIFGGEDLAKSAPPNELPSTTPVVALWKITVSVEDSLVRYSTRSSGLPVAQEPASNLGVSSRYYLPGTCPNNTITAYLDFESSMNLIYSGNETGPLFRYEWGAPRSPAPGIPDSGCWAADWTGFYWNAQPTERQFIRVKARADDGVQLEWRQPGNAVFFNDFTDKVTSWVDHGVSEWVSEILAAEPGPNWFRVSYFDLGGGKSLVLDITDADGYSNPRSMFSSFVSKSVTPVVPGALWAQLYDQPLTENAAPPAAGKTPAFSEAHHWQAGPYTIFCGGTGGYSGGSLNSRSCATWSESEARYIWVGLTSFTPNVSRGISWYDAPSNRLYIYGGVSLPEIGPRDCTKDFFFATFDPPTGSISSWTRLDADPSPGFRAWSAHWQDDQGNLWLWSGSSCTTQDALVWTSPDVSDMWMFNATSIAWEIAVMAYPNPTISSATPPGQETVNARPSIRTNRTR